MSVKPPIVLDMDGVLLQTTLLKHGAMLSLFDDCTQRRAIDEYILGNAGVRRDVKIEHILRTFIDRPGAVDELPHYLQTYAEKLDSLVRSAPLVPGVESFLDAGHAFFISSSSPDAEVELQLRSRGLWSRFVKVFGASTPKAAALVQVRRQTGCDPVFFGDSMPDLHAAREAAVPFVGVLFEQDGFGDSPIVKLRDFSSQEQVQTAIARSLRAQRPHACR